MAVRQEAMLEETVDAELADGWLNVVGRDGARRLLPAVDGFRVMEIMRDLGIPIAATCGGAAACGTCHVYVAEADLSRLPEAGPDELAQLDRLIAVRANSRLSCQIIWDRMKLDGLTVTLAPVE
jgi:2Fe-2S ferredoxin